LLRPASLLELRSRAERGEATADELTAGETFAIEDAIALQKRVGLKLVTDGEFRRRSYHSYFYRQLGDIIPDAVGSEMGARGRASQPSAVIKSRLRWIRAIHVDDLRFLQAKTSALPKITIPGPCALHFRGGDAAVTAHAYRDVDTFWDDTVASFHAELCALADAGCSYVQIDETAFAKFSDPHVQAALAARGDNWSHLIDTYIGVTNRILRDLPETLRIGMHICRGNRAGQWHSEGSYDAVADRLFNNLDIDVFFLEYDTPRAGTFTPLRFVPKGKSIVLGLISTKTNELEDRDKLRRRIDDASRYVDLGHLAVSPQCGFASVEAGNPITPEIQEAKLRLVVDLANVVWGTA
jgi:5-methyltetrahydropteroyltriglutamate--homocysteine methyltransferase